MDVRRSHTYDAPLDAVLTMLRDPEATVAKYASMGHRDIEVIDCSGDDDHLRVESTRVVDVDIPAFAKRFLKPTNTMRQVDEWRAAEGGEWDGTFTVEVKGAPLRLSGTMHLAPGDGTCTEEIAVHVSVNVPLVGGKIADWAGKNEVQRSLDGEFAFNEQWLAEHAG
jgi:hypothetical protein